MECRIQAERARGGHQEQKSQHNFQDMSRARSLRKYCHFKLKSRYHHEQQIRTSPASHPQNNCDQGSQTWLLVKLSSPPLKKFHFCSLPQNIFHIKPQEEHCLTREKSERSNNHQHFILFCFKILNITRVPKKNVEEYFLSIYIILILRPASKSSLALVAAVH